MFQKRHVRVKPKPETDSERGKSFGVQLRRKLESSGQFRLQWVCHGGHILQQLRPVGDLSKDILLSSADLVTSFLTQDNHSEVLHSQSPHPTHTKVTFHDLIYVAHCHESESTPESWWKAKINTLLFIQFIPGRIYWEYIIFQALWPDAGADADDVRDDDKNNNYSSSHHILNAYHVPRHCYKHLYSFDPPNNLMR